MIAYEFQTTVNNGVIRIPAEYKDKIPGVVKVILMSEEQTERADNRNKAVFTAMSLDTRGFVFNREEANER